MKELLLIDNYDSFTMNLFQLLEETAQVRIQVVKNDRLTPQQADAADSIVISPGPGIPVESGICLDIIRSYGAKKPILGICLGHQAIAEVYGAKLFNLSTVQHGIKVRIFTKANEALFRNVPDPFESGLYHSWAVSDDGFPDDMEVVARSEEGVIMAIKHKKHPVYGVQFHPESYMTRAGITIIRNWLNFN